MSPLELIIFLPILAALAIWLGAPARVCRVSVDDPTRVAALALRRDGQAELLLANLTGEAVDVDLSGGPASTTVSMLDAPSCQQGWRVDRAASPISRIRLGAYAVASLS